MIVTLLVVLSSCGSAHAFMLSDVALPPRRSRAWSTSLRSSPDGRSNDVFHIQNTPRPPPGPRGPQNLMYQTIQGERARGQVSPSLMNSGGWAAAAAIQGERARDNASREYNDYQNRVAAANSPPPPSPPPPDYQQPYPPQQPYYQQQQQPYQQAYQQPYQQPYPTQQQQPYYQQQPPYQQQQQPPPPPPQQQQQQYAAPPGYHPPQQQQYPPPASVSYYPPPEPYAPPPPAPPGHLQYDPTEGLPYGPPAQVAPPMAYAPQPPPMSYAPQPPPQYEQQQQQQQPQQQQQQYGNNPWPWRYDEVGPTPPRAPPPPPLDARQELPPTREPETPTSRSLIWQTLQSERASGQVSRSIANTGGASAMYHSLQAEGTRQGRRGVSASNAAVNAQSVLADASDAKVYEQRRAEPYYLRYEE